MTSTHTGLRLETVDGWGCELLPGQTTIGRAPTNKLVLSRELISRHHAIVQFDGMRCSVMDLASTHGTALNQRPLPPFQSCPLQPGDVLTFGGQTSLAVLETMSTEPLPRKTGSPVSHLIMALSGAALVLLIGLVALGLLFVHGWQPAEAGDTAQAPAIVVTDPMALSATPTSSPTAPAPTPTPTVVLPTSTPIPLPGAVVVTGRLNVRAGPGTVYTITGSLRQGDELEVIGKAYRCHWLRVLTPSGKTGWVSGLEKYVTLKLPCSEVEAARIPPRPTSTPTPKPTADTRPTVRITLQNDTNGTLHLTLEGPARYGFTLSAGRHALDVVPGSYHYTASGCRGATKSGSCSLTASTGEWQWWCRP